MKTLRAIGATTAAVIAASSGLFVTSQAQAADTPGGYALIAGGNSKFNDDCSGTTRCDTSGNAFKFVGGYRLGNGFAIEGVALDFGKATATAQGIDAEFKVKAYGAGVAVYAALSPQWLLSARLGVASVKANISGRAGAISVSDSESTTSAYAGLGLAYHFTDTVSVELGFDTTKAKFSGESENVSAVTIGVGFRF